MIEIEKNELNLSTQGRRNLTWNDYFVEIPCFEENANAPILLKVVTDLCPDTKFESSEKYSLFWMKLRPRLIESYFMDNL